MKTTLWLPLAVCALAGCESLFGPKWDHTVTTQYSMPLVETSIGNNSSCTFNYTVTGHLEIDYTETATGLRGEVAINDHKHTYVSATPSGCSSATGGINWNGALNGTASNLTFTHTAPIGHWRWKFDFAGALSDGVITGTLTVTTSGESQGFTTSGSASTNVTLR